MTSKRVVCGTELSYTGLAALSNSNNTLPALPPSPTVASSDAMALFPFLSMLDRQTLERASLQKALTKPPRPFPVQTYPPHIQRENQNTMQLFYVNSSQENAVEIDSLIQSELHPPLNAVVKEVLKQLIIFSLWTDLRQGNPPSKLCSRTQVGRQPRTYFYQLKLALQKSK